MGNPKTGKPESGIRNPESQIIVLPIQRVKTILNIKTNLRPKNVCLGLIRPKVSFYECLGYFLLSVLVKQWPVIPDSGFLVLGVPQLDRPNLPDYA